MSQAKPTLGSAIDQLIAALEPLDGDARRIAVTTACTHLKIPVAGPDSGALPPATAVSRSGDGTTSAGQAAPTPTRTAGVTKDIRSFKAEKNPRSAREMACVVAFYLQELAPENERKESISTADLEKYFKQAGFQLPTKLAQILPDAKSSGYFDSPSRAAYKLNAVGYNLVAHKLPAAAGNT
jgi:hypothetical protein